MIISKKNICSMYKLILFFYLKVLVLVIETMKGFLLVIGLAVIVVHLNLIYDFTLKMV